MIEYKMNPFICKCELCEPALKGPITHCKVCDTMVHTPYCGECGTPAYKHWTYLQSIQRRGARFVRMEGSCLH